MHSHLTHLQVPRAVAIEPAHNDMHPGRGIVAMPAHDVIARRAYYIYLQSGCKQGQCAVNWDQAESELLAADRRA